ncbi:hypothetical protein evm_002548 [Chilo suppressalis]|nr:hypothetical protein evm_002548 [Chilo suppressalis]
MDRVVKIFKINGILSNGKTVVVPSLSNWIHTIEGIQQIVKYFKEKGITSLLLRNFNQDPLEIFFGAIRAHGQANTMPNAAAFQNSYKTLLINNMSSPHSIGANCEKDDSKSMQLLRRFLKNVDMFKKDNAEISILEKHLDIAPINMIDLISSGEVSKVERCAAIGYCSGWIVKNIIKNITKTCPTYKQNLERIQYSSAVVKMIGKKFTCEMYNLKKKKCIDVNDARFQLFVDTYKAADINEQFSIKVRNFDGSSLPPCKSELWQHFLRTIYISNIWNNADKRCPSTLHPEEYGWINHQDKYLFKWFDGDQLPGLVADSVQCPSECSISDDEGDENFKNLEDLECCIESSEICSSDEEQCNILIFL